MRAVFSCLMIGTVVVGIPLLVACGSEDETHYGPPGGLKGATFPSATSTATNPPDAGSPPPTDGGVTPTDAGGGDAPVTGTAKKWSTDVYPLLLTSGIWKCTTSGCHVNGQPPAIDPNSATNTYNTLVAYKLVANPPGMQYIVPGQTDPTKSAFDCNLKGTCGQAQMPVGGAVPPDPASMAIVESWLASGAPNN